MQLNTPKIAVKIANIVLVLGAVCSILVSAYATYKLYNPAKDATLIFYILTILVSALLAIVFLISLQRLSDSFKVNLSLLVITTGLSIYTVELFLEFSSTEHTRSSIAKSLNISYDTRTQLQVLDDLRQDNEKSYANVAPYMFKNSDGLDSNSGTIYPLGGPSNITTFFSNELGYFPIIETDEHGFNNPKGLFSTDPIDIVIIGDSYAEGYSVHPSENIQTNLRIFGFTSLSLGKMNNSAFLELATVKEYAEPLEPKVVLWLFSLDDISELEIESRLLRRYLIDENFSQHLLLRQNEIDKALLKYLIENEDIERKQQAIAKEEHKVEAKKRARTKRRWVAILELLNLRTLIGLTPIQVSAVNYEREFSLFKQILHRANDMVSDWEGSLYFIYVPSYANYTTGDFAEFRGITIKELKRRVLDIVSELDIPFVDLDKEVFLKHLDPLSLFPLRGKLSSHYTGEGYYLVAEAIAKRLRADVFLQ